MSRADDFAWLAAALPPEPPADVVPRRRRPDRATVEALLGIEDGAPVTLHEPRVVEDVDGLPAGVETTTTTAAWSRPSLAQLGWTEDEWADPTITE